MPDAPDSRNSCMSGIQEVVVRAPAAVHMDRRVAQEVSPSTNQMRLLGMHADRVRQAAEFAEGLLAPLVDRWRHVQGVARRVEVYAVNMTDEEVDLVRTAAWLHDVGYAPALVDTGMHAIDGAAWARRHRFDERVVSLVAHHTGARAEAQSRGFAERLAAYMKPDGALTDALTAADLTTGPTGDVVSVEARIGEILDRYATDHPVHRAVFANRDDLVASTVRAARRAQNLSVAVSSLARPSP